MVADDAISTALDSFLGAHDGQIRLPRAPLLALWHSCFTLGMARISGSLLLCLASSDIVLGSSRASCTSLSHPLDALPLPLVAELCCHRAGDVLRVDEQS